VRYFLLGVLISAFGIYLERAKLEAWLEKEFGLGEGAGAATAGAALAASTAASASDTNTCGCSGGAGVTPSPTSIFPSQPSSVVRAPGGFGEIVNNGPNYEPNVLAETVPWFSSVPE
jgi:uncharacterized integral membrane protein